MNLESKTNNRPLRVGLALAAMVVVTIAFSAGSSRGDGVAAPADPVAMVNGEPISRADLSQCLIEAHGKHMLREMAALEVARQRGRERKVAVTRGDVDAEELRSLPPEVLDKPAGVDREKAMDSYLANEGLTRVDWRLLMECTASLRKQVAVPEPSEAQLRQLFNRKYGEHVAVRAIQVRTPAHMTRVEERLAKEPFEIVAREESDDKDAASKGGLVPAFDRDDPSIPLAVREAAFALNAKGDTSDRIDAGDFLFKLKLVERSKPTERTLENERKELTALLRERLISIQVKNELQLLLDGSEIDVLDPILRQQTGKEPVTGLSAPSAVATAPGAANSAVARVNGESISRAAMTDLLIESHGQRMLLLLIARQVVRQKAREGGVRVTPADVETEQVLWMTRDMLKYDGKDRERMLDDYLTRNSLTRVDWRLTMERNALLRKLVVVPLPTEQQLRLAFNHLFGERVKIREIRVRTLTEMRSVEDRLANGRPFEEVALSPTLNTQKRTQDATLEFSKDDERIPEAVRGVAFALKDEPGAVSGRINSEGFLYKIKIIKCIEPDTDKTRFEDERGKLSAQIMESKTRIQMNTTLIGMLAKAKKEILDPVLRQQFEKSQAAAPAAPTTAPALTITPAGKSQAPPAPAAP
jgi:parvulin-like peptidyl-prolyl isomerase